MLKRISLRVLSAFFIALTGVGGAIENGWAQTVPPVETSADPVAADIDTALSRYFVSDHPGAAVIVTRNGKILFRKAYGMADMEHEVALQPDMTLRLGSITKQFTAAAIMLLADQGKLSISDDINKYLPDYPTRGATITLENLLTHTSGIRSYTEMRKHAEIMRDDMTVQQMIDFFKDERLEFQPGERFSYSNSGYFLLGAIIEKVSGMPYAEFMEKHIFEPLHMEHTAYDRNQPTVPQPVKGYTATRNGFEPAPLISMTQPYAAGALRSNVDDLALWNDAISTGKLLSSESWKRMFTSSMLNSGASTGYGYGWFIRKMNGVEVFEHGGLIPGFSADMLRFPQEGIFIAILTNDDAQNPPPISLAQKVARAVLRH